MKFSNCLLNLEVVAELTSICIRCREFEMSVGLKNTRYDTNCYMNAAIQVRREVFASHFDFNLCLLLSI
jgi:hypothetical protein